MPEEQDKERRVKDEPTKEGQGIEELSDEDLQGITGGRRGRGHGSFMAYGGTFDLSAGGPNQGGD